MSVVVAWLRTVPTVVQVWESGVKEGVREV